MATKKLLVNYNMPNQPLRILDLRDSPWVDGPGRTILQTASMVDPGRCEIIIGAFDGDSHGDNTYLQEAKSRQLEVFSITEKSAFDKKVIDQIKDAIKTLSIDIVHTHDFRSDVFGLWCAKKMNIPVISTCHGWITNDLKGQVYATTDRFLLRFFNHIIAVSNKISEQLIQHSIKASNISVIPNALILSDYQPDNNDQSFRQEINVDKNTRLIANIGRLSPEKGQEIFIQAAHNLLKNHKNICFLLIGIGPQQIFLEALVKELGISDYVKFIGFRKDMVRIYNSLDLVVQSSSTEGMPNVILESLLMEVPVIATDVGGTSEVVQNEFSGMLISPNNIEQLVYSISNWIDNPSIFLEMAANGRKYVSNNFDHTHRVDRLMETYEMIFNRTEGIE